MTELNFETMRRAMVSSQLRTNAVNDPRVLAAMGAVARERFVPGDHRALAYVDTPVPLANGRALNAPMVVGRLLTEASPEPDDRALVVGAATGYSAALLAQLVGSVVAVEEDAGLIEVARQAVGDPKVRLVEGPLAEGWAEGAPYDLILIDGAVDYVPEAIVAQLSESGRLVGAIAEDGVSRLSIGRRAGRGFGTLAFADAEAVVLPGFRRSPVFTF